MSTGLKTSARFPVLLAALLVAAPVAACAPALSGQSTAAERENTEQSEGVRLRAIADRHAGLILRTAPEWASMLGVSEDIAGEGFRARLSRYAPEANTALTVMLDGMVTNLQTIDRTALTDRERITFDVLQNAYGLAQQQNALGMGQASVLSANPPYVVNQLFGPQIDLPRLLIAQHAVRNTVDAENWLSRLASVERVLDELATLTEQDAARGIVPPYFTLEAIAASSEAFTTSAVVDHPIATSFKVKLDGLDMLDEAARRRILCTGNQPFGDASLSSLSPVWRAYDSPAAGSRAGCRSVAARQRGGRLHSGLGGLGANGLTPDEIHQIGLDDVTRIHGEMDAILKEVGYREGSIGERMAKLATDPAHLIADTDAAKAALIASLQAHVDAVLALAPQWFTHIPDYPIEVRRIPVHEQDTASGGYYTPPPLDGSRPGIFWINLKDARDVPVYTLKSLVFHEAVPGHHLQASAALAITDLPLIQNMMWFGDYGEGWALYAEELAKEMGLYDGDPLGDLGRLRMELYRAARLVVDTGLHHKRWSREKAIDYMVDVTGESRSSITREIERYAVWPGQAASYKLGMIQFQRLRANAETTLGDSFDIREFHDVVLRDGSMPMTVLTGRVEAWIDEKTADRRGGAKATRTKAKDRNTAPRTGRY